MPCLAAYLPLHIAENQVFSREVQANLEARRHTHRTKDIWGEAGAERKRQDE